MFILLIVWFGFGITGDGTQGLLLESFLMKLGRQHAVTEIETISAIFKAST